MVSANAHVRTCHLCRQRRVKCDRQFPRCSTCVRSNAECVYPPGRGRAPKRPRGGADPPLSERLTRLENIISQLSAAEKHPDREKEEWEPPDAEAFDHGFSRLKIDASESHYVNNALWVTLSNEVEELRDLLFESEGEIDDKPDLLGDILSPATASSPSSDTGINAAIFGYRAMAHSLRPFHPSLQQAVALFAAFTENIAPLVRIFHIPTLRRVYWDSMASLDVLDRPTEALLFALHYAAVVSLTPEQCGDVLGTTREAALGRYRFAAEQALARGDLLNTQSMTMVQAAVLFLSARPNEDDSRAAWALTALVHHIARTMGLHRDGSVFGLRPFETEMRRRLWWQICIVDNRSSENHCSEPIVARAWATDTKPPLHVNDADLTPDMAQPPAERWDAATDMTLTLVRWEALQTAWRLGRARQQQQQAVVAALERRLQERYLPICQASVPFQLLTSAVARIILARFWLITHYAASRDPAGSTTAPGAAATTSDDLFARSIDILEASVTLLADPALQHWTWYCKTHIQWGAMAFVLSALCARPPSAQCDRAWASVTIVYDGWRVRESRDDVSRLALWRPIRRLMAKARDVRERQQTVQTGADMQTSFIDTTAASSQMPMTSSTSMTPDDSLSELSAAPGEPEDALRRLLGTEALDPLMGLVPSWPWADMDTLEWS